MGRMDEAPALIDRRMFEQPLDRSPARPGQAILDFSDLFGGMDVDRAALSERNDRRQFVRRHGPQAVRRDADIGSGQAAQPALREAAISAGKLIDGTDETALAGMRRCAAKGAVRIKTRQQRQPDAGGFGSLRNARPPSRRGWHRASRRDHDGDSGIRRRG